MQTKVCSKCGIKKSTDDFHTDRNNKDGLYGQCKDCRKSNKKPKAKKKVRNQYIYRLRDERTGFTHYVGRTSSLTKRIRQHAIDGVSYEKHTLKGQWVTDALRKGNGFSMDLIEEVTPENVQDRERYWIMYHIIINSMWTTNSKIPSDMYGEIPRAVPITEELFQSMLGYAQLKQMPLEDIVEKAIRQFIEEDKS